MEESGFQTEGKYFDKYFSHIVLLPDEIKSCS